MPHLLWKKAIGIHVLKFTKPNRTGMDENWNEHHGHLRLGESSCLTDPTMIEWLSYAMEEVFLGACRGRTTTLLPLLARSSVPITQERDIFNWNGYLSVSIPVFQSVGNSISFYMSLSDLPRMAMPKQKSRSRSNELTGFDAEFSPCPLPYIKWFHCRCSCSRWRDRNIVVLFLPWTTALAYTFAIQKCKKRKALASVVVGASRSSWVFVFPEKCPRSRIRVSCRPVA